MNPHLDDHDLAAALAGLDLEPATAAHLAACDGCERRIAELRRLIDRRRLELLGEAPDWQAQRRQVLNRLAPPPARASRLRPVLAAAAAALVAVALSLLRPPGVPEDAAAPKLDIETILAEVDAVLADDALPGFEAIDPGLDAFEDMAANGAS